MFAARFTVEHRRRVSFTQWIHRPAQRACGVPCPRTSPPTLKSTPTRILLQRILTRRPSPSNPQTIAGPHAAEIEEGRKTPAGRESECGERQLGGPRNAWPRRPNLPPPSSRPQGMDVSQRAMIERWPAAVIPSAKALVAELSR